MKLRCCFALSLARCFPKTSLSRSSLEFHLVGEGAARPLDDDGGRPDAALDALGQVLAQHVLGHEAAHERVAGAVRVYDLREGKCGRY